MKIDATSCVKNLVSAVLVICAGAGSLSCGKTSYPVPVFEQAPPVLEIQALISEYAADPSTAATMYEGKTFLFPSVAVDQVKNLRTLPGEEYMSGELFAASGQTRFYPKYLHDLDAIGPGFVMDITGEVKGCAGSYYSITDCTYWVLEGGTLPPPSGY